MTKQTKIVSIVLVVLVLGVVGFSVFTKSATPADKAIVTEEIKQLFVKKYPKYATTLSVKINQETTNHVRGSVSFVLGAAGGNFLAVKIDDKWQIVFDGNGGIPCTLSSYNFPANMLSDCAK